MNEKTRNRRIDKAQLAVLFHLPFFAPGVAKLPIVWDESVPTACTDGERIRWNPDWFDELPDPVVPTVLCHEVAHCLLGHLWRLPAGGDFETWNEATDHAVNNMLKDFGEQAVANRMADPFPMPDGKICCDPRFKGKSEEEIFADLAKNRKPGGTGKNGSGASGGMSRGGKAGKGGSTGTQQATAGPNAQGGTPPRKPFGEFYPSPGQTPAQAKEQRTDWKNTFLQSVAMAKGQGSVPGDIMRLVDEMLNPRVPWVELVRTWLREKVDDDYSWMRPNPYFDESGFILPSLDSERMGTIIFATDTSGSINAEILAQFQTEKQACLDDLKPAKLVDIYCDARITKETEYRVGEQIGREAPGGGGTSFVPVFERLEEMTEKPKLVVYLTDLFGDFPKKHPDFPTLWVVYNNENPKAPFGDVVKAK